MESAAEGSTASEKETLASSPSTTSPEFEKRALGAVLVIVSVVAAEVVVAAASETRTRTEALSGPPPRPIAASVAADTAG